MASRPRLRRSTTGNNSATPRNAHPGVSAYLVVLNITGLHTILGKKPGFPMYTARYLSPMIPSYNLEKTVSFFIDMLDFKIGRDDKTYFILYKDNLTIHILRAGPDIGEMEFYLVVDDIEQVWNNMKDKIDGMTVREPFNREYGMREIHLNVPETKTLMFIGQEIKDVLK